MHVENRTLQVKQERVKILKFKILRNFTKKGDNQRERGNK